MSPRSGPNSKKARASKPKVKTGCNTCKKRHVKCDETKPECLKCTKFGRKCEGYSLEDENLPKGNSPPLTRKLLSKALQESTIQQNVVPLQPQSGPFQFHDELEYHYFCIFRDQTSVELAGGFDPSLWNSLVVQACDNTAIRELTTAVAALSVAGRERIKTRACRDFSQRRELHHGTSSHLQYSLMQYGKALKRIRMMVATGQDTMRIALIAALLIFVFECMHGDTDRAVTPVQSALEMILRRLATLSRPYRASRTNPHLSQTPAPIDEELLSAFMRLDGLALALLRTEDQLFAYPTYRIFSVTYHTNSLSIPQCFATISEARLYLEDIKWRIVPLSSQHSSRHPSPQQDHYADCYDIAPVSRNPGLLSEGLDFDSIRQTIRKWFVTPVAQNSALSRVHFTQWNAAFAPLLEHSMTAAGANTFVPAATLYIQALVDKLALADQLVIAEYADRDMDPDGERFRTILTILRLSRQLIEHPSFSRGFVFDNGILWTLVQILLVCSDRNLKWEAYEVVRSMIPRREGVWDSKIVAEAAKKMLVQEDGKVWVATKMAHEMADLKVKRNGAAATRAMMTDDMVDFEFVNSDFEDTASDRDSIDPGLLQNDTPSMIAIEDCIDPLFRTVDGIGGVTMSYF